MVLSRDSQMSQMQCCMKKVSYWASLLCQSHTYSAGYAMQTKMFLEFCKNIRDIFPIILFWYWSYLLWVFRPVWSDCSYMLWYLCITVDYRSIHISCGYYMPFYRLLKKGNLGVLVTYAPVCLLCLEYVIQKKVLNIWRSQLSAGAKYHILTALIQGRPYITSYIFDGQLFALQLHLYFQ